MEEPVDWSAKVELFEQIRREYEFGVGTVLGIAKKLGVVALHHNRGFSRRSRFHVAKSVLPHFRCTWSLDLQE